MDVLRIDYDTGYMELNVEAFFPCTMQKARIIFPLIGRWCSDSVKAELMAEFNELAEGYESLCRMYEERQQKAQYNRTMVLYKRMKRNMEYLKKETMR